MKRAALGDVVRFRGALCEVIGIGQGTTVTLREVGKPDCPTCGRPPFHEWLEDCRIFQDEVQAVSTLGFASPDEASQNASSAEPS